MRCAISAAVSAIHGSMVRAQANVFSVPELPEMEIVARRLSEVLPGQAIESVMTPGINVLKTFDPPLSALEGAEITDVRRRGKLLLLEADGGDRGPLTLLMHLMSAGRLQLQPKRGSLRDKTSRVLIRLPEDRELRLREFGTKQRAWVKLLRPEAVDGDEALSHLGPEAWPDPPDLKPLLDAKRPLHSLLRDQSVVTGIGRTWVDEILNVAHLSPFKRGDDLDDDEAARLRDAMVSEMERVLAVYEEKVALPLPEKFPKPTRVHAHQGEPCPRCEGVLEAVFYEDYVMTYCPACQTDGRVLKDRRLSRLLK
jgi:formamidopyrimidine-DNA glycosylase